MHPASIALLDLVYQPQCAACGAPAASLCAPCAASLVELGPACPRCAEPSPASRPGATCVACGTAPPRVARTLAPWRFGGQLASAIRRLKFTGRAHVARDLAPLWAPALAAAVAERDALVVPVPLHWRRRAQRGYDHAWLLALHACALAGLPRPVPALRRTRHADAQSTLPAAARHANVRGAFAVRRGAVPRLAGRAVVLVDDVITTGATMAAAARALLDAGAASVTAVALARAT
jgi:ComF family protein